MDFTAGDILAAMAIGATVFMGLLSMIYGAINRRIDTVDTSTNKRIDAAEASAAKDREHYDSSVSQIYEIIRDDAKDREEYRVEMSEKYQRKDDCEHRKVA